MKLRKVLTWILKRILPIAALAAVCVATVLFAGGYFTFSFLSGEGNILPPSFFSPLGDEEDTQDPADTLTPGDLERPSNVTLPDTRTPQTAGSREDILTLSEKISFPLPSAMDMMDVGFTRSTEVYAKNTSRLSFAGGFDFFPKEFSNHKGAVKSVHYEQPYQFAEPVPVYETKWTDLPSVELYMGYILLDDGRNVRLYTADGVYLFSYYSGVASPAYTRDLQGHPLFYYQPLMTEDPVYATVHTTGFVPSDYDDTLHGRGLYFDYSPSFGISDSTLLRIASESTTITVAPDGTETAETDYIWAYGFSPSWRRTSFRFTDAWEFSEDVAAVTEEDGRLYYIGPYGYSAFTTQRQYYYSEWYVQEFLLPPLTNGPESIGFYYFDHGLVRARRRVIDWSAYTYKDILRVAVDEDFLMDKNGKEFPVPEGYDIVSYSDGVILLTRDGKYGYMDYTGAWIAQPMYDYARPFHEGLAVVGFGEGDRMMIDTAGDIVIPMGKYDYISDVSDGVIAVWRESDGWSILHKMAKYA